MTAVLVPRHVDIPTLMGLLPSSAHVDLHVVDFVSSRPVWADVLVAGSRIALRHEHAVEVERRYGVFRSRFAVNGNEVDGPIPGIDVALMTWAFDEMLARTLLERLTDLRWVHSSVTGTDWLPLDMLRERQVQVTSPLGIHGRRIAEFVIAYIMADAKRLFDHAVSSWMRHSVRPMPTEMEDITIGIVGYGGIGRSVAALARRIGASVIALRRGCLQQRDENGVLETPDLIELLARADALVLSLPYTPDTERLIDGAALSHLRRGAVVVNVGRGGTLDLDALVAAVQSGHVRGACLDVVSDPLTGRPASRIPKRHPIFRTPGIIFTGYTSSMSRHSEVELLTDFARRLSVFEAGGQSGG